MAYTPRKLRSAPGIKRDGTRLEGDFYTGGRWCRFQRGLPRKMGGYRSVAQDLPERVYGFDSFSANDQQYFHLGSATELQQRIVNNIGAVIGANDRTPPGLIPSDSNIWQFDQIYDTVAGTTVLIAHAAPNMDLSSQFNTNIFYGPVTATTPLADTGQDPISGGVIVVGNYLVSFGNGGLVQWSAENSVSVPTLDSSNVTQQKIVVGKRVRGGGVPAALLWSLDSLLIMTFNDPATQLWDFDTITDNTSILSSRSVIEYDGVFYWAGVDRFLAYNGVVRELPNDFNVNFFFDNLNFEQRQKVFAYKVPRFGEIWWCFPFGPGQEDCNHAVVYNVREGFWYDTPLPSDGRTDGLYAKVYFKPFMTSAEQTGDGHDLWQHETGYDRVRLGVPQPIVSNFETKEFTLVDLDEQPVDKTLSVDIIEPDFVQRGALNVTVAGRANARSPQIILPDNTRIITETAADADEQIVRIKTTFRMITFKFESNTLGGNFEAGENIGHFSVADGRITQ